MYIRLAQTLLAQGRSVMILVPEIALTPPDDGAVFRLLRGPGGPAAQRPAADGAVRPVEAHPPGRGTSCWVPGRRCSPRWRTWGLIILDEEQESSYESEKSPCYHARDIAKYRCFRENARLLLGSATPPRWKRHTGPPGDYQLALLRRRYNAHRMPRVILADMRRELRDGNAGCISRGAGPGAGEESGGRGAEHPVSQPPGQQPGAAVPPVRLCAPVSPVQRVSDLSLRQRADDVPLLRLFRKSSEDLPGVRRRHEAHRRRYPEGGGGAARPVPGRQVLRMDADTVSQGHEKLLRDFQVRQVPILLGTQMVAKGLDFANVTLVGVLAADMSLYVDHYRASERTFSLLTQVVGRAGRGDKPGRAVIQTYTPPRTT